MIRCNLNTLLAERGLKISKVVNDTKISRPTLTAITQNAGKGIQFETLNTLCNYLNVTPSEFFSYLPYDFEISILDYKDEPRNGMIEGSFTLFISVKDNKGALVDSWEFPANSSLVSAALGSNQQGEIEYITSFDFKLTTDATSDFASFSNFYPIQNAGWKYTIKEFVARKVAEYFESDSFSSEEISVNISAVYDLFDLVGSSVKVEL